MNAPIVFLHGFPLSGSMWQAQMDYFKKYTTVFAPDLRGHGRGPQGPGPWLIDHYVEDLFNLLKINNIEKATLCGLSMGGYIALQFINEYPDRVQSLILCDTQSKPDSAEAKKQRFNNIQKIHKDGLLDFAQKFLTKALAKPSLHNQPELHKNLLTAILENKPENVAMVLGALTSRPDYQDVLSEIHCPTLVIAGEEDTITPPNINKLMAENIPGAEFKTIAEAGHLSSLEKPNEFNQIVAQFLNFTSLHKMASNY